MIIFKNPYKEICGKEEIGTKDQDIYQTINKLQSFRNSITKIIHDIPLPNNNDNFNMQSSETIVPSICKIFKELEKSKQTNFNSILHEQFKLLLDGYDIIIPDFFISDFQKVSKTYQLEELQQVIDILQNEIDDIDNYKRFSELEILQEFEDILTTINNENFDEKTFLIYSLYSYIGKSYFNTILVTYHHLYPQKSDIYMKMSAFVKSRYTDFEIAIKEDNKPNIYKNTDDSKTIKYISHYNYININDLKTNKYVSPNNYTKINDPEIRKANTLTLLSGSKIISNLNLLSLIKNDDVEALSLINAQPQFNLTYQIVILDRINKKCESLLSSKCNLIEASAFYGSLKCFKFLLLNIEFDIKQLAKYAVAGGNVEIVRICDQNKYSFIDTIDIAIYYHQNDIGQWIIDNNKDFLAGKTHEICIEECNFTFLQYFLNAFSDTTLNTDQIQYQYLLYVNQYIDISYISINELLQYIDISNKSKNKLLQYLLSFPIIEYKNVFGFVLCPIEKVELLKICFESINLFILKYPFILAAYFRDEQLFRFLINFDIETTYPILNKSDI